MPRENTLAYHERSKITDVKSFLTLDPGRGKTIKDDKSLRKEVLLVRRHFVNLTFCQLDILST